MFQAMRTENKDLINHLWRVGGSVAMTVNYISGGGSEAMSQLLSASLVASSAGQLIVEDSFLVWSEKVLRFLDALLGPKKRSLNLEHV